MISCDNLEGHSHEQHIDKTRLSRFKTLQWCVLSGLFIGLLTLGISRAQSPDLFHVNEQALQQHMVDTYGESGLFIMNEWLDLLDHAATLDVEGQLRAVNDFFNDWVEWTDDLDNWGYQDFWATPMETLAQGQGDCEDYSIGKYTTLRLLGIDESKLRLIYVNARLPTGPQAHMVLGYFETPSAQPLILDNINPEVLPAAQRPDLSPVFSFNSQGLWVGGRQESAADPTARLSRWRSVLSRMQNEGFRL